MKTSPTKRSLKLMRDQGFTAQVTERWNQFAKKRIDLFGFCDILAISPTRGIVAVQTTTAKHFNERWAKIRQEPKAALWLASGGRIQCHGWAKRGARGKRKLWECQTLEITVPMCHVCRPE